MTEKQERERTKTVLSRPREEESNCRLDWARDD